MSSIAVGCPPEHRAPSGRPCSTCRRERVLAVVIAAEPSLSTTQVTDAFDAAVTNGAAVRALEAALAGDPEVLHVGHRGWSAGSSSG